MNNTAAIVLAAGRGKRMKVKKVNKVVLPLANKPMIARTRDLLKDLKISPIIVVVGFAKKSVINVLGDSSVIFVEQKKRLGTGNAVKLALAKIKNGIKDVLVLNGDDSAFYRKETILSLIESHK